MVYGMHKEYRVMGVKGKVYCCRASHPDNAI